MTRLKHFLIVAFLFFAPAAFSQVTLPDSVAIFYLEQNERVKILSEQTSTLKQEIKNLEGQLKEKKTIEMTLKDDGIDYRGQIQLKKEELAQKQDVLDQLKKDIRKYKRKIVFTTITAGAVVVLTLILAILSHG